MHLNTRTCTALPLILSVVLFVPTATDAAGPSHFDRALENSRRRIEEQRQRARERGLPKKTQAEEQVKVSKLFQIPEDQLTIRQKKLRRRRTLTAKRIQQRKLMSDMDFLELVATKDIHKAAKRNDYALKYLERLLLLCTPQEAAGFILEMADIHFEEGDFKKAAARYNEFVQLHPGHERIEYALYRAIDCSFKTTLTPDRDQRITYKTLDLIKQFEERSIVFKNYLADVQKIKEECYKKLALSECNICEYYYKQGNYKPLIHRIAYIRKEFPTVIDTVQSQLLTYEDAINKNPRFAPLLKQSIPVTAPATLLTQNTMPSTSNA